MASGFLLNPDKTFQFFFSYGALDRTGTGTWTEKNGQLINSGGRVLGVTALAENMLAARQQVYQHISQVQFEGAYFRKDIGL